jgi:HNH endonuclease
MPINRATRQFVRERSNFLCEYCHSSEAGSTSVFTFDHILPQSLNGSDGEENLALACIRCNGRRYNFTTGIDPKTQTTQPLFNPRNDDWADHFIWSQDGTEIIGITLIGRATVHRLDMNDDRHDSGSIRRARQMWIRGGWHPPSDDPRQSLP